MCCEFLVPCPPALLPDMGLSVRVVIVVMVRLMLERQEHGGTSI